MKNIELECVPGWRYTNVRAGEKRPYPNNWQQRPTELAQIESSNIGLLLGPVSHGVVALDFDGPSAWTWYDQVLGLTLPATVAWASGKAGRCQMAFHVPSKYWMYLRTVKITHTKTPLIAEGEGFEFRWAGCQSVMPPSRLDDGREYVWLASPSTTATAPLPEEILCYWLNQSNPDIPETPPRDLTQLTRADVDEVDYLLGKLKQKYTTLDYEIWRNTAWAVAHHIGVDAAQQLMPQYWPERKRGEYAQLFRGYNAAQSPTLGSVRYLVGPVDRDQQQLTQLAQNILRKMKTA